MEWRGDGENRGSSEGGQRKEIERVEDGVDGRQTKGVEAMEEGVEGRQTRENEKMEDGGERRQAKGIEKMNDGVEGCQAARCEKMESKAVRPGGSRQEDWLGGAWKSIRRSRWSGHVLANKANKG